MKGITLDLLIDIPHVHELVFYSAYTVIYFIYVLIFATQTVTRSTCDR